MGFLHELEKATQTIEVLQSLNYMEVFMSLNDQFQDGKVLDAKPNQYSVSDFDMNLGNQSYNRGAAQYVDDSGNASGMVMNPLISQSIQQNAFDSQPQITKS
jgi:hypothetical protein